jgi:hypothetical protein
MIASKGCGFGLTLKGVYMESTTTDVISIDPSTEFILSGVEWTRDDKGAGNLMKGCL